MNFFDGDLKHELLLPSFEEVFKAFFDLSMADLAVLIGAVLWLVLLRLSLNAIDRRDVATGATYILFMMAASTTLMLALPARLRGSYDLSGRQVFILIATAAIAAARWLWQRAPAPRVVQINDGKDGQP